MKNAEDELVSVISNMSAPFVVDARAHQVNIERLEQKLSDSDYHAGRVNIDDPYSEKEFFKKADQAFNFPDWFGFNWSALKDSLLDFHWKEARGYIFILEHSERMSSEDLTILREIAEMVGKIWAEDSISFKLVLL